MLPPIKTPYLRKCYEALVSQYEASPTELARREAEHLRRSCREKLIDDCFVILKRLEGLKD